MVLDLFIKRNSFGSCLCLQLGVRTGWILIEVDIDRSELDKWVYPQVLRLERISNRKSIVNIKST